MLEIRVRQCGCWKCAAGQTASEEENRPFRQGLPSNPFSSHAANYISRNAMRHTAMTLESRHLRSAVGSCSSMKSTCCSVQHLKDYNPDNHCDNKFAVWGTAQMHPGGCSLPAPCPPVSWRPVKLQPPQSPGCAGPGPANKERPQAGLAGLPSMAFKREGDDLSQLNVLRKRRVADLLASYIPEDEAVLMRNGRYACSICTRRPVFDTVDMLAVHRRGRKHLASLQHFYNNKRNLQLEVQKRQHQQQVRQEEGGPSAHQTRPEQAPLLAETRRITHHALRRTAPYSSCSKRRRPGIDGCSLPSGARGTTGPEYPLMAGGGAEPGTLAVSASHSETRPSPCDPVKGAPPTGSSGEQVGSAKGKRSSKSQDTAPSTPPNPERQRQLEHYLKLRSSGWIPDGCGKWIQDETVEFDSDEEEPSLLPPPSP